MNSEQFRRRVRWAFGVIKRGQVLILLFSTVAVGLAVLYLYSAQRQYSTTVDVLIDGPDVGESLLERSYSRARLTEAFIQTEADILSSSFLAERVIQKLNLAADPEFNPSLRPKSAWGDFIARVNPLPLLTGATEGANQASAEARTSMSQATVRGIFLSKLQVKNRRRSFVISVTFTAENGEKAARIANMLADLYVVDRLEAGFQEAKRVNSWLTERLEELRRDVATAENAAEQFRTRYSLAQRRKGERQLTVTEQQLVELNSRLVLARADLAQKRARQDQLRQFLRNRGSIDTATDVLQSNLIQRLREQEAIKQRELSEAMQTYGEKHPKIIGQQADLVELRRKITAEIDKIALSLAAEVEAARVSTATLESEIEGLKGSSDRAGTREVELREFERQAETSRQLYEAFLSRYKRDMEQEKIQRAHARVLSEAPIPSRPSSPRRLRILFGALLGGLIGGCGFVFLLDRLNGRIRSSEEAEQFSGYPVLASVPYQGRKNRGTSILEQPRSILADAFRTLRAVLAAQGTSKVLIVTSSVPGEGKSFITRNLALAFASLGGKVLVIDADLMRPVQHKLLGSPPKVGLGSLLRDASIPTTEAIARDPGGMIDIMPAGEVQNDLANTLAGSRFSEILADLRTRYDLILIDSPPVLVATDAQILAREAEQVIFVIKANDTTRDALGAAIDQLAKLGAPIAGVVLSQIRPRHDTSGYYGHYAYYEKYGK